MIMWTNQPYSVYVQLMERKVFSCDETQQSNLKDNDNFQIAYCWMVEQMKDKVNFPPSGVKYPIWAWYKQNYAHRPPDFRRRLDYEDQVCIEIEVPENLVLLSDFEKWHFVLNDWYLPNASGEAEWLQQEQWFDGLSKETQRLYKQKSWQKIFDVTPRKGEWTANGRDIQGCFWVLKSEYIRKVWRLQKGCKTKLIQEPFK